MKGIGCTVCEIFAFKLYCDLEIGFRVIQGQWKWHYSVQHVFIFVFHSKYASIYYRFRDIAAWSKLLLPLYLSPPLGVKPSELRNDPWWRKTRMMGLSDGERISMMPSSVLIQYTRVIDGRNWRGIMLSRVKTCIFHSLQPKRDVRTLACVLQHAVARWQPIRE